MVSLHRVDSDDLDVVQLSWFLLLTDMQKTVGVSIRQVKPAGELRWF
jgi:hypothetical protein